MATYNRVHTSQWSSSVPFHWRRSPYNHMCPCLFCSRWWGFANWLSRLQTANSALSGQLPSSPKQNTLWRRMIMPASYRLLRISLRGEFRGPAGGSRAAGPLYLGCNWLVLLSQCFCFHFGGWGPGTIEVSSYFAPAKDASLWYVKALSVFKVFETRVHQLERIKSTCFLRGSLRWHMNSIYCESYCLSYCTLGNKEPRWRQKHKRGSYLPLHCLASVLIKHRTGVSLWGLFLLGSEAWPHLKRSRLTHVEERGPMGQPHPAFF